jgi:signal transduction histidine kinase
MDGVERHGTSLAAGILEEQQSWRETVLTGLGWTTAVAGSISTATNLLTSKPAGAAIIGVGSVSFLLAATLRGRVSFHARIWLLLAPLLAGTGVALLLHGYVPPNADYTLGAAVVLATLLLGKGWGLAVGGLASGVILGADLLHLAGCAIPMPPGHASFGGFRPAFVVRSVLHFTIISATLVVAISHLLGRAEALLLEKAGALERLRREEGEAQRMREELVLQEQAMRKAREIEILGRLAGSVAHDFNNALLIIGANVDLIRHRPDHLETGLREIEAAVLQATSTTRQLRGFSPQAAAMPRALALAETVQRTATMLERVLPSNIEVMVDVDGELAIFADEGHLQGIVTNLALNARDAMPRGGKLELCVREATAAEVKAADLSGRFALLDIADDGVGMSDETRGRVFEPYFTTKGPAGTGLGLASVKAHVEAGGGRILVTSALGRGTRFRVLWPLHTEKGASSPETNGREARRTGTVLLVEDDKQVRDAVARALGWSGFHVLEASNGDEAMTMARRYGGAIDVLLSDCVMPGLPVQKVIEGFRGLFPAGRVVLCSAYAPEQVAPPQEMIDAFVAKPCTLDSLTHLVGAMVARAVSGALS